MKKIDVYSIDINKALFFALISIFITIVSILFFIVPTMQDFKLSKIDNRHARNKYLETKEYYNTRVVELKELTKKNRKTIEALQAKFDKQELKKVLSKNFSDINIKEGKEDSFSLYFTSKDINISGEVPTTSNFFDAVKSLNNNLSVINIEFPITIKSERGDVLNISFPLREYKVKDLNETFTNLDIE